VNDIGSHELAAAGSAFGQKITRGTLSPIGSIAADECFSLLSTFGYDHHLSSASSEPTAGHSVSRTNDIFPIAGHPRLHRRSAVLRSLPEQSAQSSVASLLLAVSVISQY
jgi:hypothetical protein